MSDPRRRFRFLKDLSEGAFGKVYMAEMVTGENFSSIVAIKLLHGKWVGHEEIVQRSRDEARVLGKLHHRNIIRVEDLTSINGQCAIIMEYLNGVDIKTLVAHVREKETIIPRRVAFDLTAQIASALDAAYNIPPLQGGTPLRVIHRDIKPSNVMVTPAGDVKVLDFGTAQAKFDEREAHTQSLAFGSAAYMAPERLLGDPDDPSWDVFSLGITLYEMLFLDSFGKIHIRPERYETALDERLAALSLDSLGDETANQVRTALRLMLSYDAVHRPTADQVVDLMEALADEVSDGNLRRFCREVVAPCRDNRTIPENPEDPLTGSTLFEDSTKFVAPDVDEWDDSTIAAASRLTGSIPTREEMLVMEASGLSEDNKAAVQEFVADSPEESSAASEPAVSEPTDTEKESSSHTSDVIAAPEPEVPQDTPSDSPIVASAGAADSPPMSIAATRGAAPQMDKPPAASSKGSGAKVAIIAVVVLGLLAVLGGIAVVVILGGDDDAAEAEEVVETIGAPEETTEAPKASDDAVSGGVIEVGPSGPETGILKLTLSPEDAGVVKLVGKEFKLEWDGSGTLELQGLPAGSYRTKITSDGPSRRSAVEFTSGQTACFTFDINGNSDEWSQTNCD